MGPVALLREALAHGGRVLWDPPDHPRLQLPHGARVRLEPDRDTIREVLHRAAIFRDQVNAPGPTPLLVLPTKNREEGCLSCGAEIGPEHFRCEMCMLAVQLALEATP